MLIETKMNFTKPLVVFKSLNPLSACWFVRKKSSCEDENNPIIFQINFGEVVFGFMNHINKINDYTQIFEDEILELTNAQKLLRIEEIMLTQSRTEVMKKLEEMSDNQCLNFNYNKYYEEILDIIENKEKTSKEKLLEYYNIFKDIAACIMCGQAFVPKIDKTAFPSEKNPLRILHYEMIQGNICEAVLINGYDDLFALDLFELLFNPHTKIYVKKCKLCGDFFANQNKKMEYCTECGTIKDKINNDRNRKKEKYILKKSILEKIDRNKKFEFNSKIKRDEFFTEYNYYCDIVKYGTSQIKRLVTYKDIKTEAELLEWLKDYEDSVRAHPKKQKSDKGEE